jgi:hypothetical protein
MSLFGKILAVLNVLGAIGLFLLAVMDYGKRQAWSYNVMQHELVLRGMPLDDKETDAQGRPLADRLSEGTIAGHFANAGGSGKPTQVEEVADLQAKFNAALAAMPSEREQTHYLARILLPLSETYLEREELLAARYYFATDALMAQLRKRYQIGFDEAKARVTEDVKAGPKLTFEEALYVAMRAQYGEPSDTFTMRYLQQAPTDVNQLKTARSDTLFDNAVKAQLAAFRERMKQKFARALTGPDAPAGTPGGQSADAQKKAIARLLFALAQVIAEDRTAEDPKLKGMDKSSVAYADALGETDAYKTAIRRVYAVCGLRMTLAAMADEAALVREQAAEARRAQEKDLSNFVADNDALIEELRDRYELVKLEQERAKDSEEKLKAQEELVKKSKAKVEALTLELAASRNLTLEESKKLSEVSDTVLKLRLEVRDAIKQTEEAEKEIRRLEGIIRARERQASSKSRN